MHNEALNTLTNKTNHLLGRLEKSLIADKKEVNLSYAIDQSYLNNNLNELNYKPIKLEQQWGIEWQSAIFKINVSIPKESNVESLYILLDLNGEILILDQEQKAYAGLTSGSVFKSAFGRNLFKLPSSWIKNNEVTFLAEAAANHLFGIDQDHEPAANEPKLHGKYKGIVNAAHLVSLNQNTLTFKTQLKFASNYLETLPKNKNLYFKVAKNISNAITAFYKNNQSPEAGTEALKPIFQNKANHSALTSYAVGHAHIDTGWLWPVKETIRKCGRTFATQIRLIEKYPSYVFGASQPQHYQFTKDHYPEIYSQIKKSVAEGRWECQGAMWVEADNNLISGESMARQILYGKLFYKDEFNVDVDNLWLPDVFGYSAALPQILKKSGVNYFLTQKISWNKINKFPHNTFFWEGIDGSQILTHFPPEDTYNSLVTSTGMAKAESNFRDKGHQDKIMTLFGVGDGGGGPKDEMIENALLMKDLEESVKVKLSSAKEFFDQISKDTNDLAVWKNDLYLEFHQGTFTTQAKNKKWNRNLEFALQKIEFLYSSNQNFSKYPSKQLDKLWKTLMINQFHDIIPGSSINQVYVESSKEYKEMEETIQTLINDFSENTNSNIISAINPFTFAYNGLLELPPEWNNFEITLEGKGAVLTQAKNGKYFAEVSIPALESITLNKTSTTIKTVESQNSSQLILENDLISYSFNEKGEITKIVDKETRATILPEGKLSNQLKLFEDFPHVYDAWDIMEGYEECETKGFEASSFTINQGKLLSSIMFNLQTKQSQLSMTASLTHNSKALNFEYKVNWQENKKFLRVYFPISISNPEAFSDIAYGYNKVELHKNTTWEFAKDELVCHKYVTICNQKNGIAILNDCKYGFKIQPDEISLSLLRAPTYPDPLADRGEQVFSYTYYPYDQHFKNSDVIKQSYFLNTQPITIKDNINLDLPFSIDAENLRLEAFKKCEKENAFLIRLVEMKGNDTIAKISTKKNTECKETDIMEETSLNISNEDLNALSFKPFEIRCFKFYAN